MRLVLNNSLHFEWLEEIARRLSLGAVSTDFLRPQKVVVQNMPSGVYSQVSPKVFRLGRKSFGRWRWEVLLKEDEMEKVKRRWFWNGLKKSAWPILEFVTLRSKFVTLIFRTLGGEKLMWWRYSKKVSFPELLPFVSWIYSLSSVLHLLVFRKVHVRRFSVLIWFFLRQPYDLP